MVDLPSRNLDRTYWTLAFVLIFLKFNFWLRVLD